MFRTDQMPARNTFHLQNQSCRPSEDNGRWTRPPVGKEGEQIGDADVAVAVENWLSDLRTEQTKVSFQRHRDQLPKTKWHYVSGAKVALTYLSTAIYGMSAGRRIVLCRPALTPKCAAANALDCGSHGVGTYLVSRAAEECEAHYGMRASRISLPS